MTTTTTAKKRGNAGSGGNGKRSKKSASSAAANFNDSSQLHLAPSQSHAAASFFGACSCAGCEGPILDQYVYTVLERPWHQACIRCGDCGRPLADKCFSREGLLFCRDDFIRYGWSVRCLLDACFPFGCLWSTARPGHFFFSVI